MSAFRGAINAAAGTPFQEPKVSRVARATAVTIATGALFVLAALRLDGWLSGAFWVLAGWRALAFFMLPLVQATVDERMRRLHGLSPMSLKWLRTGEEQPNIFDSAPWRRREASR